MRNTASDLLESKERSNLFMIIDPAKEGFTEISTVGSTLDVGATLLPFLGYSGDLGLGRNLLNEELLEKDRLFIHSNLNKWRQSIGSFWDFPKIQGSLKVNIDEKYVSIDSRQFGFPIFIELNRDLESTLKFQFDKSPGHKSLVQHRKELDDSTYFILIDKCANTKELDELLDEDGFCIMAGEGKKYTTIGRLEKNITYTYDEIRNLLGLAGNI
jgi:phosphoglycerol transferase